MDTSKPRNHDAATIQWLRASLDKFIQRARQPVRVIDGDDGSERDDPGCPRGACDHSAADHDGLYNDLCGVDECPCGQSNVMDGRALGARTGRGGWVESSASNAVAPVPACLLSSNVGHWEYDNPPAPVPVCVGSPSDDRHDDTARVPIFCSATQIHSYHNELAELHPAGTAERHRRELAQKTEECARLHARIATLLQERVHVDAGVPEVDRTAIGCATAATGIDVIRCPRCASMTCVGPCEG